MRNQVFKKVLVVDDNREAADLTAELIKLHGHVAATAYSGQQAIQMAMELAPDVVLLDLGMPVVDGFAVALALRQVPALNHAVLVAHSAWSDGGTRAKAMASGFDCYLPKPAQMNDILQVVSQSRLA